MKNIRIGIIGGLGNLGSSLTKLLKLNGYAKNLKISDVKGLNCNKHVIKESNIIFLTVKPNNIIEILNEINDNGHNDKIIISCAAGINIDRIQSKLDPYYPIIRCMPNLPIQNKEGSIPYFLGEKVDSKAHFQFRELIEGPIAINLKKEEMIDVATVFTGSMPGFISFLSESYINFGLKYGFSEKETIELFCSSLRGTASLLKDNSTSKIIEDVSSPGGVTEKGIHILQEKKIYSILEESLMSSFNHIKSIKND